MFLQAMDLVKDNQIELPYNIKVILDSEEEKEVDLSLRLLKKTARY